MRILYSFPHRLGGAGGINATALEQVRGAIDLGIDVVLYCANIDRKVPGANHVVTTLSLGGLRVPHRTMGIRRSYRYHDWRVSRVLQRLEGIDLVHCWPQGSVQTLVAARNLGIKTVREVPNTHTAHAFDVVAREMQKLGLAPLAGHSHTYSRDVLEQEEEEYRLADYLLVPSEFSKRTFLNRGVPAEKLVMHQLGFDPGAFFPSSEPPKDDRPLRALFVARGEARKGLHYALDAWLASGVPERGGQFTVCGEFVAGYREALGERLAHPSVKLLGFVHDLGPVMRENDIFLYPALEDGSALVTYMAQACGCVLVVSEAAGARCVHGEDGLVHPPGDVPAITDHIRLLDRDRRLLGRLRQAAVAGAQKFTWKRAAEQLVGAYKRMVCSLGCSWVNGLALTASVTGF
jgi:glycosyltransferase involved in cell wall biosynthesis